QLGPDVLADRDLGDVDRKNLERRVGVQTLVQHGLGDRIGVGQHVLVIFGRADGVDDALTDAGDDGFFRRTADQALDVGAHGDAGLDAKLDAVLGHAVDRLLLHRRVGHVDHLGVHAGLHGVEDVAAGEVD